MQVLQNIIKQILAEADVIIQLRLLVVCDWSHCKTETNLDLI